MQTNLYILVSLLIRLIKTAISKNRAYPESSFTMAHISNSFCLLIRIKSNLISSIGWTGAYENKINLILDEF